MIDWIRAAQNHYVGGGYDLQRVGPPGDAHQWRLEGRGKTRYFRSLTDARRAAGERKRSMRSRRSHRKAKPNPKTTNVLVIGGGLALVALGAYFFFKPKSGSTTAALAPSPSAGGSMIVYTDPNTGAQYTRDHACQVARQLTAIGRPAEAASWAKLCTQNGGTV